MYSRIPSLSIHYVATLLDPKLSGLKSLKDYFATTSVVPFVIQMVQDLGSSLSKLYPADRPEPVTSTPANSTPTYASTPTDAVNPEPEVVEVQPPVLNCPPSKAKSLQIKANRKRILLIKKYSFAPAVSGHSSLDLNHKKISREITNYTNSVHSLDLELHDFWRINNSIYRGLYQLARVVHVVPATSAEIECVMSREVHNFKISLFHRHYWCICCS